MIGETDFFTSVHLIVKHRLEFLLQGAGHVEKLFAERKLARIRREALASIQSF